MRCHVVFRVTLLPVSLGEGAEFSQGEGAWPPGPWPPLRTATDLVDSVVCVHGKECRNSGAAKTFGGRQIREGWVKSAVFYL